MNEQEQSPASVGPTETELSKDERMWGMLAHLSALSSLFTGGFGFVLGPLIVWLIKKEEMPFVDDQGKEALNFQITMLIGFAICATLTLVLIGFLLLPLLALTNLVFVIIAAVKANEGTRYRYPFAIRLIK